MDVTCATKHAGEAGYAAGHDKDCLQMCESSGFGVLTDDGRFIGFDVPGNQKAVQLIKDTQKDTG